MFMINPIWQKPSRKLYNMPNSCAIFLLFLLQFCNNCVNITLVCFCYWLETILCKLSKEVLCLENLNSNYLVIQSVFSASDIDNLTKYFKRIWMSDATYKVAVARRAFNLNQVFIDALSAGYDENYRTDDIISDTALLLYAEELADYYRAFRSFPSILIADDILVYGRRIAEIISDLETLIVW